MASLFRKIISYKFFPICWTLFTIVLLCLPGSMVPGDSLLNIEHLDKLVHVILFGANVLFWGWHYSKTRVGDSPVKIQYIYIFIAAFTILLGIILEFIQRDYIPNRSFDGYDIVADVVGSVLAAIYLLFIKS